MPSRTNETLYYHSTDDFMDNRLSDTNTTSRSSDADGDSPSGKNPTHANQYRGGDAAVEKVHERDVGDEISSNAIGTSKLPYNIPLTKYPAVPQNWVKSTHNNDSRSCHSSIYSVELDTPYVDPDVTTFEGEPIDTNNAMAVPSFDADGQDIKRISFGQTTITKMEKSEKSYDSKVGKSIYGEVETVRASDLKDCSDISGAHDIKMSKTRSQIFQDLSSKGRVPRYTPDCYSFMAVHSPFKEPFYFFFGLMVFIFQVLFLMYMILNKMDKNLGMNGEVDNPSDSFLGRFIPSNVTGLVHATQITAVLSYVIFADSSLKDCAMAVEQFPRFSRVRGEEDHFWLASFSCVLRFSQGFLAAIVTFLLIVTSADVIDIILNFAAVNFISTLDECAFELAKWGKYGPALEKEAKSIENRPIPYCIHRKYRHIRFMYTMVPIAVFLIFSVTAITIQQSNHNVWVTQSIRVQFDASTGLQDYSGCYNIDQDISHYSRKNYNSFESNTEKAILGYCKKSRQWMFFKNNGDNDGDGGVSTNACDATEERENQLAHSSTTDFFDVYSSVEETWFSASGTPLDMYFFETNDSGHDLDGTCGSFLNNGVCDDEAFNKLAFQYDGGDCCAPTCQQSNCGQGGATGSFGSDKAQGIGFRHCKDPNLFPVTIFLESIVNSRLLNSIEVDEVQIEEYYQEKRISFWDEKPHTPFFSVDCDGKHILSMYIDDTMEKKSETIMVRDGASCEIIVSNVTDSVFAWDNDPMWWVNYTVYHGSDTSNKIISGYSGDEDRVSFKRIPDCYLDVLTNYIDISTVYTARTDFTHSLAWIINDESDNSECDNPFLIERFALAAINFAAPIIPASVAIATGSNSLEATSSSSETDNDNYLNSQYRYNEENLWISTKQQCRWENIACNQGSLETLGIHYKMLDGTISTSIGLLTGLMFLDYEISNLVGVIPSEIGMLTKLTGLDLDNNLITGTIPTALGYLRELRELDLDFNELTGTIPTEFGQMIEVSEFDLKHNQLSGTIPTDIFEIPNLIVLDFGDNILSGTIAEEIGSMKNLEVLKLGNNNITGSIAPEVGQVRTLKTLDLKGNALNGRIPTEIGQMTILQTIDLRGNSLTGPIPSEMGLLTELREIRLEGNKITGTIPFDIDFLEKLHVFTMDGNVTGSVPNDVKTLDQCILCEGKSYDLSTYSGLFYEKDVYGRDELDCRKLHEQMIGYPSKLLSANACRFLEDRCAICGSGPFRNDENMADLLELVF